FSAANREGPFAWSAVPPERMREIIAKLADFETMDHGALRQCRHPHNLPGGVVDEAWQRLVTLGRDDLERVFSFHLGGTERIWCADYKGEGVMFVLWWDPEHRIYPVRKRHT
ncbi:MAG TPA: hypothetical protein VNL18_13105, partial [Gemmatimonadales bacterium]|nr:hypothetical protein [Gemmatimonadales bacterium]